MAALTHCQEKVAECNATAPRRRAARRADPAAELAAALPAVPPAGFRLAAPSEGLTGTALVGQAVLYRWPVDGWVRGTVARVGRGAGAHRDGARGAAKKSGALLGSVMIILYVLRV